MYLPSRKEQSQSYDGPNRHDLLKLHVVWGMPAALRHLTLIFDSSSAPRNKVSPCLPTRDHISEKLSRGSASNLAWPSGGLLHYHCSGQTMTPAAQTQLKPFQAVLQHLHPEKGDGKTEAVFWAYARGRWTIRKVWQWVSFSVDSLQREIIFALAVSAANELSTLFTLLRSGYSTVWQFLTLLFYTNFNYWTSLNESLPFLSFFFLKKNRSATHSH